MYTTSGRAREEHAPDERPTGVVPGCALCNSRIGTSTALQYHGHGPDGDDREAPESKGLCPRAGEDRPMFDLVLKGGTVIDPSQGLDGVLDVAVAGGEIAEVKAGISTAEASRVVDVSGKLVMAGLVDFHTHVYWAATRSGLVPDEHFLKRGITTVVDAGSCGAETFPGFKKLSVEGSRTRVYCFVHLSCLGLTGNRRVPELANPAYADPEGAVATLREHPDVALGLKLRLSKDVVGGSCLPLLKMARAVCDEVGVPLVVHVGNTEESLPEILQWLKAGDVVAHYMTGRGNGSLDDGGRILPEVWEARERGVLFDAAPATSHFAYRVADRMLDQGFLPDAIGTDLTTRQMGGLMTDVPMLMSRLMMLGMPLADVVRLATFAPARILGKADRFGALKPNLEADIAVFQWEEGEFPQSDGVGETRMVRRRLAPYMTVRSGQLV